MNQTNTNQYDKLFVGGDLSGIQKFLYNITSRKAAVSLKGRSHYLRQYMERIYAEMMELPAIASVSHEVIYCSGGKFYALVQNTPEIQDSLLAFAKQKKQELWRDHYGHLSINISIVPFSENLDGSINVNGLTNQPLGTLWKCLTEDFARQKNQKFLDEMKADYASFFEVTAVGCTPKVCAVTGVESDKCVTFQYRNDYDAEEKVYVLPSVKEQIKLGEKLRDEEHFRTFEEYADGTYLGILRMDVDGLGKLFASGFKTIKEYKTISSKLDSYFTSRPEVGHVSNLQRIQQKDYYRNHICIIYAGGDDIFAVGRWDKMIDFAAEVQEDFAKYVGKDGVTISGGVAIVHPKFPIAKAAELAGDAEDTAKDYEYKGVKQKNAFCMFGKAISWKDEFDYVAQYKNEFVELIDIHNMPRGILHKIMTYAAMVERNEKRIIKDYSYIWHSAYYLTRVIERVKEPKVKDFCKRLRDQELYGTNGKFRLMAIAARWAELTLRKEN